RATPEAARGGGGGEREQILDGVVRAEGVDRRLADDQPDDAGERRPDEEADQERDAVRTRTCAANDDERRGQDERAGCRDDRVEDNMEAGINHSAWRATPPRYPERGWPTPRPWRPHARAR